MILDSKKEINQDGTPCKPKMYVDSGRLKSLLKDIVETHVKQDGSTYHVVRIGPQDIEEVEAVEEKQLTP